MTSCPTSSGLDYSLFDIASAQEVPLAIPQYMQCNLHGLTSVLLYDPFILLTVKSVELVVACDGFPLCNENHLYFHRGIPFKQFLIRTAV